MDRDVRNGAKNIFRLRNYEALGISPALGATPLQSGDQLLHGKCAAALW